MKEYRCKKCEYRFCFENEIPYCPACDCEYLEEIVEKTYIEKQSHHIHPKFMSNPRGLGQKFIIDKKTHSILHGKIMKWIWEEVKDKNNAVDNIIMKSKEFLGVE